MKIWAICKNRLLTNSPKWADSEFWPNPMAGGRRQAAGSRQKAAGCWDNWGFIGHRVTELQTPKGTQYTGGWNFFVSDFNKLPYLLRLQGDKWKPTFWIPSSLERVDSMVRTQDWQVIPSTPISAEKIKKTLGSEYRKHLNPGLMIIPYSDDVTFCFWSTSKHLNTRLLILVFRFHYQGDSRESSSLEQHSRLPILDQEVHSFSLTFSKSFHLFHFQDSSKLVKYQYIKAKCLICHKKGTHFMAKYVEARKKRTGKKDGAI